MDVLWIPLLATLALLHQTTSASDTTEMIGVLGGSVTFRTQNTDGNAAHWSFGNEPIVTVKFEDSPTIIFLKDEFKTRFAISERGHVLSISQLRMEDAGTYSVTINGKTSTFRLQVFRELPEPTVTCEAQNCSHGSCSSSLRCSAPGADLGNVSYTWSRQDRTWDGSSVVLLVNESAGDEPEPLTCTARNPVSSRSVTVPSPGVLCAGALSSSQLGVTGGIFLTAAILVALLSLLFLGILWKSKGWRKFHLSQSKPADTAAEATSDYATVYAEVGPSQQRVPDGAKAKPADGAPATTIYSLVKHPDQAGDGKVEDAAATGLELV
ncbi:T-lymphocyte surface antigen Ly-9-like [Motacilla alba alba]|uniref:T-lymphocyte surface antigen Ly-9-like n=1 Tax=Motacilla alba alba TaxID=1094192 RepID=UPI0018D577F6|nr:T-lymphocyte surface antigen Ly-9-like [Motacilla alba alba]